jgi:hypothetical protein
MSFTAKKLIARPDLFGQALGYKKLLPIHGDWIRYIWFTDESRALQAHRGSYKTTAITVVGSIIYALLNPDRRICILRKDDTSASGIIQEIAQHMKGAMVRGAISYLYKGRDIRVLKHNSSEVTTSLKTRPTKEAQITGRGLFSSLTGQHYERIITDDIVTLKDRVSGPERERTIQYRQELRNIINPGYPISDVGTPWHKEDAFSICPEPARFPVGQTGIADFTKEYITELRNETPPDIYSINYLLEHSVSKNKLFKDAKFGKPPQRWEPVAHVDKAYKGKDTIALTMFGYFNGQLWGYGKVWKGHIQDHYNDIAQEMQRKRAGTLWTEENDDKGLSTTEFSKRGIVIATYHEKQNKHVKIIGYLYPKWTSITWDEETDPEYISQIIEYEEGEEPDDAPDSASSCLRQMGGGSGNNLSFYNQT